MRDNVTVTQEITEVIVISDPVENVHLEVTEVHETIEVTDVAPAPGLLPYVHPQPVAADVWIVNHGLGARPVTEIYDVGGRQISAEVIHIDDFQLRIYFASARTGFVRCV